MSITINNQKFEANRIGSFRPSEALAKAQSKLGTIILDYCSKTQYDSAIRALQKNNSAIQTLRAKNAHNAAYHILTKKANANIQALIIYASPSVDTSIANVVRLALDNHVKVFQRIETYEVLKDEEGVIFDTIIHISYIEYLGYKAHFNYHCGKYDLAYYTYTTSDTVVPSKRIIAEDNIQDSKSLSQAEKDELSFEIKYYDLEYPQSEAEWSLVKDTIAFYKKNNIPYAFDKNQYYICPECKSLAKLDMTHICFDEEHKYDKLDYIVNGGE